MSARMNIHPTAIVDPKAELAEGVSIGPYAVIGGQVRIGAGTRLDSHCVITGDTVIGSDNRVGVGAVIGLEPQDLAYRDWPSKVRIGNKNNIREYVQIHRGTKEGSATEIGDGNFLLGFSHVAHNCRVGDNVILANGALLAGYAEVGDRAFISGHCLVHQFCRIGPFAMMRGGARVSLDIPPYCVADDANAIRGINVIGMERGGVSAGAIREVKKVYREVFDSGVPLKEQVEKLLKADSSPEVRLFLEFIRSSERGVCRPAKV